MKYEDYYDENYYDEEDDEKDEWSSIWDRATIPTPSQMQYFNKYVFDPEHERVRVIVDTDDYIEFMFRDGTIMKMDREVYP